MQEQIYFFVFLAPVLILSSKDKYIQRCYFVIQYQIKEILLYPGNNALRSIELPWGSSYNKQVVVS